ncbi:MAG TPA: hypothetical protein VG756_33340 [Pseudonocardiaceae bacterium]|nr:hypothetical protein [Pseudonocardiaceae bacterium]
MSSRDSPEGYYRIVAVDIADFTNPSRTHLDKVAMQAGLYQILEQGFDESGIGWANCRSYDRGDGALILVPASCSWLTLADHLASRLFAALLRYNKVHSAAATIQLRMVLHAGEVSHAAQGDVSDALNMSARLLDAPDPKARFRESGGVLALIASDSVYHSAISEDPVAGPAFERVSVDVKHVHETGWLRIFGAIEGRTSIAQPLDVLSEAEHDELRGLLTDVEVAQLPVLVARATGVNVPADGVGPTVWDAVEYLLDINARPVGVPPVLIFVALLTTRVEEKLGQKLLAWNESVAGRHRVLDQVREFRVTEKPEDDALLHLMVLVEHDGVDPERLLVSHLRQDNPEVWPPQRSDVRVVGSADLENEIDDLVRRAEIAWSGFRGEVALEFVLPRTLLHLPVQRWRKEANTPGAVPLSLEYTVVLRSLERMRSAQWHRVWHNRWQTLTSAPHKARVHFARPADPDQPYRINAELTDPQLVAIVLSQGPDVEARPGDELAAALRSGLPAVLWVHPRCPEEILRTAVTHLAEHGGLRQLPARLLSARRKTMIEPNDQQTFADAIHNLVLMWDDPRRLVKLDPSLPGNSRGEAANERAS